MRIFIESRSQNNNVGVPISPRMSNIERRAKKKLEYVKEGTPQLFGCGDKTRTQKQVCEIFNTKYPDLRISQSTVSRIENKFREFGNVTDIPKSETPCRTSNKVLTGKFVKLACLWITEVIHVLVRCAQLKELLLLPKVWVKTQEPQLVIEHNNLIDYKALYDAIQKLQNSALSLAESLQNELTHMFDSAGALPHATCRKLASQVAGELGVE
ncbi:hypothetical protein NQ318_013674 [Aromia moschata]|uniref:DUF4817 domain-containing protein n=1 Tax=Aromia moschata TaxID=1265417 RepID=A0AAV8XZV8_9CUCU|nr:hypothetical protein NQ318_013674 [Aromia moschata]